MLFDITKPIITTLTPSEDRTEPVSEELSPIVQKKPSKENTRTKKDDLSVTILVTSDDNVDTTNVRQIVIDRAGSVLSDQEYKATIASMSGKTTKEIAGELEVSPSYAKQLLTWAGQKIQAAILTPAGFRKVGSYDSRYLEKLVHLNKIPSARILGGRYIQDKDFRR